MSSAVLHGAAADRLACSALTPRTPPGVAWTAKPVPLSANRAVKIQFSTGRVTGCNLGGIS